MCVPEMLYRAPTFFLPAPHGIIIVLDRVYNYMYGALPLFLFSLRHTVELVRVYSTVQCTYMLFVCESLSRVYVICISILSLCDVGTMYCCCIVIQLSSISSFVFL